MNAETLNANQQAIVSLGDEAVLVVAGPGAGKTTVLQRRIERLLLESSGKYSRILGITFTTVAANNLRSRLDDLADDQLARVEIGTFHAFAARILQQHGSHLGLTPNFTIASSNEDRMAIATEVLDGLGIGGDARKLLPLLSRLFERGANPDQLDDYLQVGDVDPRLPEIYKGYLERSISRGQLDFSLLIYLCNTLFEAVPAIPKQLRRVYRYICVDEFQDTNDAQFHLLDLLIGDNSKGLLFLADQDQIVYQWNGASPRRLRDAQERFAMAVMLLPTSFRCPAVILEAANRLIARNVSRFVAGTFDTAASNEGQLTVTSFDTDIMESDWIAEQLRLLSVEDYGKTAVLARSRRILERVHASCEKLNVASVIPTARYEFESAPLSMLHNMLRSVVSPANEAAFERVTGAFYEMTGRAVDPSALRAEAEALSLLPLQVFFTTIRSFATSPEFFSLCDAVVNELIARSNHRSISQAFFGWVDALPQSRARTAYAATYPEEKAIWLEFERLHRGLRSEAIPLAQFLRTLDLESKVPQYENMVVLLTAHAAKGLEFERVYLIGAAEGQFPAYQAVQLGEASEPMEEERRGFFVALTRCRSDLTISYARRYGNWAAVPSRFLSDMGLPQ